MRRTAFLYIAFCLLARTAAPATAGGAMAGKSTVTIDNAIFGDAADSLSILLERRTGVQGKIGFNRIVSRNTTLDFYFSPTIGYYPWRSSEDLKWLAESLRSLLPAGYEACDIGSLYCDRTSMHMLLCPQVGNDGKALPYKWVQKAPQRKSPVREEGAEVFPKGLSGRTIAVWQSHGRYFDEHENRWMWQRPPVHTTAEDIFTQDFVLPFIIPMLERAGAYVMTPRERDPQPMEYIIDNDASFSGPREGLLRRSGDYREKGQWKDAGCGFADTAAVYRLFENPFRAGTARKASCRHGAPNCSATWGATFEKRGSYAVYVSYASLPESTPAAHYTVRHLGGESTFLVDQRMAGGTWVYLGTFEFDEGSSNCVTLDNSIPSGRSVPSNSVVTADAVKIGGGVGKVGRGEPLTTSGLASHLEGALYWEQWAGADSTVIGQWKGDYTCDYASRGAWAKMMKEEKGVPFDLTLAVHTDAGITPCDSTIGTLAIYTYHNEGKTSFPDCRSRIISRALADMVQTQICSDIRTQYDPIWSRRGMWDKEYSESRRSDTPAIIIEMLSHQNFADMRLALDPSFRFTVSRSIYKGILKYLSTLYGIPYAVQPLPVRDFSVRLDSLTAILSWEDTADSLEPTAVADHHILYTRVDDGAFDKGVRVGSKGCRIPLKEGHLYSFKVEAAGSGGRSFPSRVLCCGVPAAAKDSISVLVVDNFNRVAGPSWIDAGQYAGFFGEEGMPWGMSLSYAGPVYELRRASQWTDNANPGFGACSIDLPLVARRGNSFDNASTHAKAVLDAGFRVASCYAETFAHNLTGSADDFPDDVGVIDLLCGAQLTTTVGRGVMEPRFQVFPDGLRSALREAASRGCALLVSGAYIGTDICDELYPVASAEALDSAALALRSEQLAAYRSEAMSMVNELFGYKMHSEHASNLYVDGKYRLSHPDSIVPSSKKASLYMRYGDSGLGAAVLFEAPSHKALSFGFPLEMEPSLIAPALSVLTQDGARCDNVR